MRSSIDHLQFDWKSCCFLCTKIAERKYSTVYQVRTLPLINTLKANCESRTDEWSKEVYGRLSTCNDLVAEEAVYHISCMNKFRLYTQHQNKRGRPTDLSMVENFRKICCWLEDDADCDLHTLNEIHQKMLEMSDDTPCYSNKSLKRKLEEHYGEHIFFAQRPGLPNLVCFKNMAWFILNDFKRKEDQSPNDVIAAAAKIIKSDIRELSCDKSKYPEIDKMHDIDYAKRWVPESLLLFLRHLIFSELKQVSIGQCISQCSRPRSMIAPIPFGIGVDIDKSFATKWLVDHLSKFGLCISSDEVKLFKQSASQHKESQPEENLTQFTQWVADNIDHNICTLTGKGTFHGMGMISISPHFTKSIKAIKRLKHKEFSGFTDVVDILPFQGSSHNGLATINLKPILNLASEVFESLEMNLDLLWQCSWFFSNKESPRPNWSGFMQHSTTSNQASFSKATIKFLPILDMNPSDETCIYSTLKFIASQAKYLCVPTPCVTFDQPLWLKAMGIIKDQKLDIVCRLGGFHTLMSFLGSIGKMMSGSGLEEVFEEVYAEHTVVHMLSGKAVARSLRAHILVQSALVAMILEAISQEENIDLKEFEAIYKKVITNGATKDEIIELSTRSIFKQVKSAMANFIERKKASSRTACLWLQYIEYVDIVKEFICAERTSNWMLHLQAVQKMTNLFAASGHINYARCSRLYIQEMLGLSEANPWLHQQFQGGSHAVRRSERYWAGLWSDLTIEQTLMRSIKSRGGLTRGRGFDENVHHLWVSSISYTAAVHNAMTDLSGVRTATSEQHLGLGFKRRLSDYEDMVKFFKWFECRNPFAFDDSHLHSLSTGAVSDIAKDDTNCENAEALGLSIQQSLDNCNFLEAKIKKKDQLRSLSDLTRRVKIDDRNSIRLDSTRLFIRLAAIAQREEDVEEYFKYELTQQPQALFRGDLMRKATKSSLRNVLLTDEMSCIGSDEVNGVYVLDGGALLHRVHWRKGATFKEIIESYRSYVRKHYDNCSVVFDGYDNTTSIKSNEHARRIALNGSSRDINIMEDNEAPYTRERFLSNKHNKTQLISLLSSNLRSDGQMVHVCKGDADTKIVSTALEVAHNSPVIVVADDTDVAVMLLYHWKKELFEIFFQEERGKKCWSIKRSQLEITDITEHLLFIHAWTGCDSTSAIFGKGKSNFASLVRKSSAMKSVSETLSDYWATDKEVANASVAAFLEMYGGNQENQSLSKLR